MKHRFGARRNLCVRNVKAEITGIASRIVSSIFKLRNICLIAIRTRGIYI